MNPDENASKRFIIYSIFDDLNTEEKQDLLAQSMVIHFLKGEIIFNQEESGNTITLLTAARLF